MDGVSSFPEISRIKFKIQKKSYLEILNLKFEDKIHLQCRRCGLDPWVGKIPWRRKWQPIPVFLPGKSMDRGA